MPRRKKIATKRPDPKPKLPPDTLSPNEAAKILNITGETVKQWIYTGKLTATKLPNGYYRIKHADLNHYLETRRSAAPVLTFADRNKALQDALARIANDKNLDFTTISNTSGALKQFKNQPPNLLVVDLDGFKGGWNLIRKIRSTSSYGSPKILLLSRKGLSDRETAAAVRLEINGCLEDTEALAAEVERLLQS